MQRFVGAFLGFATWVAFALAFAPSVLARTAVGCATPRQAKAEVSTSKLVVIRREVFPNTIWTACWRATGRQTTLLVGGDDTGEDGRASFFRASGPYTAYRV